MKGNYPDPNFGWERRWIGGGEGIHLGRHRRFIGIVIVTRRAEVIITATAVVLTLRLHWSGRGVPK